MELFRLFGTVVLDGSNLINSQLNQIESKANSLSGKLNSVGQSLTNAGTKMTMFVTLPIVGFLASAVKASADFNQQMANTGAIAGATAEEMTKLRKQAIDLGIATKYSALEVAKGQEEMIKAGMTVNQVFTDMEHVLNLATAGGIEVGKAAEYVGIQLNLWKDQGITAEQITNQLAGAANASATDVTSLAYSLKYVGPIAGALKIPFNDLVATLAVMADNGVKGTSAGTWLRQMLTRLQPASDAAAATMLKLGITTKDGGNAFYDAQGKMKPMAEVLNILGEKTRKLSDKEMTNDIRVMFGLVANAGVIRLIRSGGDAISDMADQINKVTAAEVAAVKMNTLTGSIEKLKSTWETFLIKIGDLQTPFVTKTVQFLENIVKWLLKLDDRFLGIGIIVLSFIAILGPLLIILGTLITSIGTIAGVISAVGFPVIALIAGLTALAGVIVYVLVKTGLWKDILNVIKKVMHEANIIIQVFRDELKQTDNIFFALVNTFIGFFKPSKDVQKILIDMAVKLTEFKNAIGNTGTVIRVFIDELKQTDNVLFALVNTFIGFANPSKKLQESLVEMAIRLSELKNKVKDTFNTMKDLVFTVLTDLATFLYPYFLKAKNEWLPPLISLGAAVVEFGSALVENIKRHLTVLKVIWEVVWPTLKLILAPILDGIISIVKFALNTIKDVIRIVTGLIKGDWSIIWNSIKSILSNTWELIKDVAKIGLNGLLNAIDAFMPGAKNKIISLKNSIVDTLSQLPSAMYNSASNFMNMFIRGISDKIQAVKNKAGEVAGAIKNFLGFQSPTKEGAGATAHLWMPNLMNMLTKGISDKTNEFQRKLANVIQSPKLTADINMSSNFSKLKQNNQTPLIININDTKLFNTDDIDKIMNPIVSRLRTLNIQGRSF